MRLSWTASSSTSTVTIAIQNKKIEGNLNFNIEKEDEGEARLTGAQFKVTKDGTPVSLTDNHDGTFTAPTEKITNGEQTFIYEIEETTAPTGYVGLKGKLRLQITTKFDARLAAYVVDDIKILNNAGTSINGELEVNNSNSTVTLKITNKEIEGNFDLSIHKVDENDMPLRRAKFTVTKDATGVYLTDDENGVFTTSNQKITSDGQVFTYEIQETTVPNGYIGITAPIKVKVTTGLNSARDAYEIRNAELVDASGNSTTIQGVTVSSTNATVTVKVKNTRIKGMKTICHYREQNLH